MGIFNFSKKRNFLKSDEQQKVITAIQEAEKRTSGEIRIYIESKCKFVDPLDRAAEIFYSLKMNQTAERNAVLVYLAFKDRQIAIFADNGIHLKMQKDFWKIEVERIIKHFNKESFAAGLVTAVTDIGEALYQNFPYLSGIDKNELPDDIVFGN